MGGGRSGDLVKVPTTVDSTLAMLIHNPQPKKATSPKLAKQSDGPHCVADRIDVSGATGTP